LRASFMRILILFTFVFSCIAQASDLPKGWHMSGSNPEGYDFALESQDGRPKPSGSLTHNETARPGEFGTLMQSFFPEEYLGKRVRMTAWVKSENVEDWAALWVRVDSRDRRSTAFDNMRDRAIRGDTNWTNYEIVVDVSEDSLSLNYGVMASGKGKVWFDEFTFEIVDESVALTGTADRTRNKPTNTSFSD